MLLMGIAACSSNLSVTDPSSDTDNSSNTDNSSTDGDSLPNQVSHEDLLDVTCDLDYSTPFSGTVVTIGDQGGAISQTAGSSPTITSLSDATVAHGQEIVLHGTGLGIKTPAAPLRYFDFEEGLGHLGERIPGQDAGGFQTLGSNNVYPHYTQFPDGNPRLEGDDPNLVGRERLPGDVVAKQTYMRNGCGFYNQVIGLWLMDVSNLYTSTWVYRYDVSDVAMVSDNQKLWGNFGHSAPGTTYGQPQCRVDTYWANSSSNGHLYVSDDAGYNFGTWSLGETAYLNQWMRTERYMHQGTISGGDGVTWVAANLREMARLEGTLFTSGEPYDYWQFGHFFRLDDSAIHPDDPSPAELIQYVSEMYIDVTQARIEIGDAANWDDCTHREIQIPLRNWTQTSIEFRINRGSFSSGDTAYLFVVEPSGEVSAGFPLQFE